MRLSGTACVILAGCVLLAAVSCSRLIVTGGGGTEWEAKISGSVLDSSGAPLANVSVMLLSSSYNPVTGPPQVPDSLSDTTDNAGHYSIITTQTGSFTIEAFDNKKGLRSLVTGVSVTGIDTTLVRNAIARIPGAIRIMLPLDVDRTNGYFYVAGTTIYSFIGDDTESVVLNMVPSGVSLSLFYAVRGNAGQPQIVREGIVVAENDTAIVGYAGWRFSKKIVFNTTASGAGITTTVTDFPVLVRLSSGNFDFSTARSGGADVRFTKSDGTALSYEIERWDASPGSAQGSAEIWVKVDTVFGDDSSHFIIMYWGNSLATSASNSAAVFDTATGLQGVWHLNDPVSGQVKDATSNGYNGTPVNVTAQSAVNAMVGVGRRLQGNDSGYIVLQGTADSKLNFQENGIYAIAAWVYIDTLDGAVHNFVSKCDQQYNLEDYVNDWEFAEYKSTKQWEMTRSHATAKTWTHVVGVRNQAKQYLFVNGLCVDSTIDIPVPTSSARNTSYPVMFGKSDGNQSSPGMPFLFHGILDEIRMLNRAPSVDWIKLCYMNQKQQDKLIEFK